VCLVQNVLSVETRERERERDARERAHACVSLGRARRGPRAVALESWSAPLGECGSSGGAVPDSSEQTVHRVQCRSPLQTRRFDWPWVRARGLRCTRVVCASVATNTKFEIATN